MAIERFEALRTRLAFARKQRIAPFSVALAVFKLSKDIYSLARLDVAFRNCFNSHLTCGERNIASMPLRELREMLADYTTDALSPGLSESISAFGELIEAKALTAKFSIAGLNFDITDLRVISRISSKTSLLDYIEFPKRTASLFFYLTRIDAILRSSQVTLGVRVNYGDTPFVHSIGSTSSSSRVTSLFRGFNSAKVDPVDVEGYLTLFLDTKTPFPIKDGVLELHDLEEAALAMLD